MRYLIAAIALSMLSGCASIFSEDTYPVSITSAPSNANIEIKNEDGTTVYTGNTPATVKLKAGAGYFDGERYLVTFRKDGYEPSTYTLNSGIDGWYWGNLLIGGVLGMLIIDPATGAMYTLPQTASASLVQLPPPPLASYPVEQQQAISKQQQLQQLQQRNLPYDQYQLEYRRIMVEQN